MSVSFFLFSISFFFSFFFETGFHDIAQAGLKVAG